MEKIYTSEIYELYEGYIGWSTTFILEHGGLNFLRRFFLGNSEYNRQKEHVEFFNACKKAAEDYLDALRRGEGAEELRALMDYVLVDCHEGWDDSTEWMLLAAEKNFIPLVEMLDESDMAELYEPYRKLRRKNRGLPPQDEILKMLKKTHK